MKTETITLSTGIKIIDTRYLGCGVQILSNGCKYMQLSYNSIDGFYINVYGNMVSGELEFLKFESELQFMKQSLKEANEIIK